MINRNTVRDFTPSFIPKFSDVDLLRIVIQSKIWKSFYMNKKEAFWLGLKAMYYFKSELFITPVRSLLRHSFGHRTMGYFITLMAWVMMVGFNSKTIWGIFIAVFPFFAPITPVLLDEQGMINSGFIFIHSVALMYFWIISTMVSFTHLVLIYFRKVDNIPSTKRGESWLYKFIFSHLSISETWVQVLIEPMLICGLGIALLHFKIDVVFGIFLLISGFCFFVQELQDIILKTAMK